MGLGLIAVTQRYHVFTVASPSPSATVHTQYATALVVPLLVMMATMVVTSAVSSGVEGLEAAAIVSAADAVESDGLAAVRDLTPSAPVHLAGPDGTVRTTA